MGILALVADVSDQLELVIVDKLRTILASDCDKASASGNRSMLHR